MLLMIGSIIASAFSDLNLKDGLFTKSVWPWNPHRKLILGNVAVNAMICVCIHMLILTHIHACDLTPHTHYHGIGACNMQTCNAQITCVVFNVAARIEWLQ